MAGIKELMEKIGNDEAFRAELGKTADNQEFFKKIKDSGFGVTPEELANAMNSGELSDDELEAAAGGGAVQIGSPEQFMEWWERDGKKQYEKERRGYMYIK